MRTLLICHAGDRLNQVGLARWLASFSHVTGIVVIRETRQRLWQRIRREINRVGLARFLDVLAFRLYYRFMHASRDRAWEQQRVSQFCNTYAELPPSVPILYTHSPNSNDAAEFIRNAVPDIMIARCKTLLKESVFSIPTRGTFVMHPGICPEYRNAHGCFWALAQADYKRVGMTLLRVDKGVDTGSVYGYYTCDFDELTDSHVRIQHRVVFDNLDALRQKFVEIYSGRAQTIDTSGRSSAAWGQPWLSRHLLWKWRARKRKKGNESRIPAIS
jgi:folate-dependent phosphoribosylglycinamide formyltransferase PurN